MLGRHLLGDVASGSDLDGGVFDTPLEAAARDGQRERTMKPITDIVYIFQRPVVWFTVVYKDGSRSRIKDSVLRPALKAAGISCWNYFPLW